MKRWKKCVRKRGHGQKKKLKKEIAKRRRGRRRKYQDKKRENNIRELINKKEITRQCEGNGKKITRQNKWKWQGNNKEINIRKTRTKYQVGNNMNTR